MICFRETILQEANNKNQVYQSSYRSLQSFLDKLPAEQINSSDDLAQVAAKQNSQEVRTFLLPLLDCSSEGRGDARSSVMNACSTLPLRERWTI